MTNTLDLGNLLVHIKANANQFFSAMKKVEAATQKAAVKMQNIGTKMSLGLTLPLAAVGTMTTKSFASFDDAMTKSTAIMGNMTPRLKKEMSDLALEISTKTVKSATDLAKSYFYLASAGFTAEQAMSSLSTVTQFATAGNFDMATATDLLTDAQSALGLTLKDTAANTANMARLGDILVAANTIANATVQQFSEALTSDAAASMRSFNIQVEEGVAVLAAFADQGIKGAHAGNMFGRMIRLTTAGFKDNRAEWDKLGISIYNSQQELLPMGELIGNISKAFKGLSTEQKISQLELLGFSALAQKAVLPVLGLEERITNYRDRLVDVRDEMRKVSEEQMKSFSAQITILKNKFNEVSIQIGSILVPLIRSLAEWLANLAGWFKGLSTETQKWIVALGITAAAIGPVLVALGLMVKAYWLLIAAKVKLLALTGPKGWAMIAAGAGVAAYAIIKLKKSMDAAAESAKELVEKEVADGVAKFTYETEQAAEAFDDLSDSGDSITGDIWERIHALREEAETAGLAADALLAYQLNALGATSDQVRIAESYRKTAEERRKLMDIEQEMSDFMRQQKDALSFAGLNEFEKAIKQAQILQESYLGIEGADSSKASSWLDDYISQVQLVQDKMDELAKDKALQDFANNVIDSLETAEEATTKYIEMLDKALEAGKISDDQWRSALQNIKNEISGTGSSMDRGGGFGTYRSRDMDISALQKSDPVLKKHDIQIRNQQEQIQILKQVEKKLSKGLA